MTLYSTPLLQTLRTQAAAQPRKIALLAAGERPLSYGGLVRQVDVLATNLVRQGFQRGDRVLVLVRPGIPVVLLLLAVMRAGGVSVICDIAMGQEVFAGRVRAAEPRWMFVETLLLALQGHPLIRRLLKVRGSEIPEIPSLPGIHTLGVGPRLPGLTHYDLLFADLRRPGAGAVARQPVVAVDPADDALLVFTSGTTGLPQGVVHSHASLNASLTMIRDRLQPRPTDVFYASVLHMIIPALSAGARAVIPSPGVSARTWLADLHRYRATTTYGVPAAFEALIAVCHQYGRRFPATLNTILLGAAPISAGFLGHLQTVVASQTAIWMAYGTTEMLPICAVSLAEKQAFTEVGDLVGRPLPGVQVRLAPDGELLARGPNLCRRYLGGPPLTELATGDLARIDTGGNVILTGRKKDMIIRGEHNIYPALFESSIERIPGVRHCALVGVYRESAADEEVVLVVDKADPRDDATYRRFLERELRTGPHSIDLYAQPDHIIFAPLPLAGRSQKVDRQKLRTLLARHGARDAR